MASRSEAFPKDAYLIVVVEKPEKAQIMMEGPYEMSTGVIERTSLTYQACFSCWL
jgi:hypothetical protein